MPVVWLASYPKSGNTWLRFLLYHALFGEPTDSIDISRRIADVHRPVPGAAPESDLPFELAKTHFQLTADHPRRAVTARAVLVLRHPKDVLLSGLNYARLAGVTAKQLPDKAYAEQFIRTGGDPHWAQQGFGTWAAHADSWTGADGFPVLAVRYEDLHTDAAGVLGRVLEFLEIDRDADTIARAVSGSSFDRLRALEVREKADPKKKSLDKRLFVGDGPVGRSTTFFMNKGKTGQTLAPIDPSLDTLFDRAFADAMARHGYG